ncbi:MAG: class I SAM-dependent methyltransferase [Candidatus Bathyarchaeota archaeon]|nr:class I SAM-dependent methyltransferase [Elusimicrobiota bacterium]MDH5689833.1 class I SAM-dependent methyltransferase [Candidatus Bathyarchaeota archaeon]
MGGGSLFILDIGCGDGGLLNRLVGKTDGCFGVGLDLCRTLIREGKKRYGNSVQYLVADAEYLPFRKRIFDLAVMVTLLHHVVATTPKKTRAMQKKILNNAKDAIKPEGKLLLRELCPHNKVLSILLYWLSRCFAHLCLPVAEVSFLTEPELLRIVDSAFSTTRVLDRFPWSEFDFRIGGRIIILAFRT